MTGGNAVVSVRASGSISGTTGGGFTGTGACVESAGKITVTATGLRGRLEHTF
jgi:hypothetical protein